jgi:hypothetical protein
MRQRKTMQNKNKKSFNRKYIISAAVILLLIIAASVFIIHVQEQPDPASEQIIREAAAITLRKDMNELTDNDFSKIIYLTLYNKEISDIRLLEKFTNLKELRLGFIYHPPQNIPKWKKILSKLRIITLNEEFTIDLSPLKKLTNLKMIEIAGIPFKNINSLASLVNLEKLTLINTEISYDNRIISGPSMAHKINVPEKYSWGQSVIPSTSSIERYINAYDQKWWHCIRNYANDINYQTRIYDLAFNGHPEALAGAEDGYKDAEEQIRMNIQKYGKKQTQEYLQELLSDKY